MMINKNSKSADSNTVGNVNTGNSRAGNLVNHFDNDMKLVRKVKKHYDTRLIKLIIVVAVLVFSVFFYKTSVQISRFTFKSDMLPSDFSGYEIAYAANIKCEIGKVSRKLIRTKPDLVIISGDIYDEALSKNEEFELRKLATKLPVYYVGNSDISNIPDIYCIKGNFNTVNTKDNKIAVAGLHNSSELAGKSTYDILNDAYKCMSLDKSIFQLAVVEDSNMINDISQADMTAILTCDESKIRSSQVSVNGKVVFESTGVSSNGNSGAANLLNTKSILVVKLVDSKYEEKNPLEKFLGLFIKANDTKFSNDSIVEHKYNYD